MPIERASRSNLINQRRNSRSCDRDEPIAPFFFGRNTAVGRRWTRTGSAGRNTAGRRLRWTGWPKNSPRSLFFSENLLRILTFLRTPSLRLMRPTSFLPTVGLDGSEGSDCRIFLFLNPLVLNPSDGEWKYILHRSGISTRVRMDLRDVWRKNQAASAA